MTVVRGAMLPAPELIPATTMEQVRAFAEASGDTNPVHLSLDAARSAGLDAPVLHGLFIAGRFEAYLDRMRDYRISDLRVNFVRPVTVGSALTISSRAIDLSGPELHLRLLATVAGGALAAIAEARLRPVSSPAE